MKILFVLVLLPSVAAAATLQGHIRDAHGTPVPGATVQLQIGDSKDTKTAQSDRTGLYRFSALPVGTYTLHTQTLSLGEASSGPFSLAFTETKTVDLILRAASASVEFSDDTKFVVAGVTDNTYVGGHGSDTRVRSAEALTKAAASLKQDLPAPQSEASLRAALEREPANAGLHHSMATLDENSGHPVDAAHEYQRAAELEPSETNLFDWGTELLIHGAPEPAIAVFTKGSRLFPHSSRMLLGAAVAYYNRSEYAQAGQYFYRATDVDPSDPTPYLFLGKAQASAITESPEYLDRLARFAELQPDNAWANYYYAVALWSRRGDSDDKETLSKVESLLRNSVQLDPNLAPAYLQLGIVSAAKGDFRSAIDIYVKAIAIDASMPEAHYRLAEAYRKTGDTQKAQRETELFRATVNKSAEQAERDRAELQKFVVTLKSPAPDH